MKGIVHIRKGKRDPNKIPESLCGVKSWVLSLERPDEPATCRQCLAKRES